MRRETRTIVIMLVVALGGVGALWFSAHRYVRIIEADRGGEGPVRTGLGSSVDGALDDFVAVRRAMHEVAKGLGDPQGQVDPRTARLAAVRDDALADAGLALDRYVSLRRAYRAWRSGRSVAEAELARAFDDRRAELAALDLGAWEAYDR